MIVARQSGLVRGLRHIGSHDNGVWYGGEAPCGRLCAAGGIDLGGEPAVRLGIATVSTAVYSRLRVYVRDC